MILRWMWRIGIASIGITLPLPPPVKGGGLETLSPGGRGKGEGIRGLGRKRPLGVHNLTKCSQILITLWVEIDNRSACMTQP